MEKWGKISRVLISWISSPTWRTARCPWFLCPKSLALIFPEIARKIASYSDDSQLHCSRCIIGSDRSPETKKGATPPLHTVEAFLLALASPSDGEVLPQLSNHRDNTLLDGRIILAAVARDRVEIKYQQLNPASHFRELVDTARCVIIAGGTISPVRTRY